MSVLDSIITWAEQDLPDWQSDAVKRLLTQDSLTGNDKDELLAMLKSSHGLVDAKKLAPKPQPLKKGDISGAPRVAAKITLEAIKDLYNVNRIPDGSSLPFGHKGLTVIYGENAAGKSGYARVLKRACRARDTKEQILPNVFGKSIYDRAKATFKISGNRDEVKWEDSQEGPDVLANIAVFDSKCARVIVDENNKVVYLPYGAYVFEDLVALLKELRGKLHDEKPKPEKLKYDDISNTTKAGQFIDQLSYKTSNASIEEFAKWTENDEEKLVQFQRRIAKIQADDPVKQARTIRNRKDRINELKSKIVQIDSILSDTKADSLKESVNNLNAAEEALLIVSQESLANEPLPGVGGKAWQKLYEAAKQYSTQEAYKGQDFPQIGEGSLCVLCMQPLLDDGKKRLQRFKDFMEKTVKKRSDFAAKALEEAIEKMKELDFSMGETNFSILETYKDVLDEIRGRAKTVAKQIEQYFAAMAVRAKDMIKVAADKEVGALSPSKPSPTEDIAGIAENLENEAKEIEKAANPEELANQKSQRDELQARKLFAQRKQKIINYLEQLKIAHKYEACIGETDSGSVTRKGRTTVSDALTPQLMRSLKAELEALGANHLNLNLKPSGGYGETSHKMELAGIRSLQRIKLTDILSEGEQHVVAIAGFLAELKVGEHQCPIVFDDPVCSLDHKWRRKVAKRLVEEAKTRQVIVFSHDIVFANDIMDDAEHEKVEVCTQHIFRKGIVPGYVDDKLPWKAGSVADNIDKVEKLYCKINKTYNTLTEEDYENKVTNLYSRLRAIWERVVEDVAFCKTALRHRDHIRINVDFKKIAALELKDCEDLIKAHKKCCDITEAHDPSRSRNAPVPNPQEVKEDINTIRHWVTNIKQRQKAIA